MADFSTRRLAALTGVKSANGSVLSAERSCPRTSAQQGARRRYDQQTVRRLSFVRHARDPGFSVEDIRQLLELSEHPTMSCEAAIEIANHHLRQVEGRSPD